MYPDISTWWYQAVVYQPVMVSILYLSRGVAPPSEAPLRDHEPLAPLPQLAQDDAPVIPVLHDGARRNRDLKNRKTRERKGEAPEREVGR